MTMHAQQWQQPAPGFWVASLTTGRAEILNSESQPGLTFIRVFDRWGRRKMQVSVYGDGLDDCKRTAHDMLVGAGLLTQ